VGNSLYTLKCIKCGDPFHDTDIEIFMADEVLICDLCAFEMSKEERSH
jgi:DNA-directed RNA polymerase subunit RPC12/RpoP